MPHLPFSPSNHLLYSAPTISPCCSISGGMWPGSLFSSSICFSCIFSRSISTIALCWRWWLFRCELFCARMNHCLNRLFEALLCSHALDSSKVFHLMPVQFMPTPFFSLQLDVDVLTDPFKRNILCHNGLSTHHITLSCISSVMRPPK